MLFLVKSVSSRTTTLLKYKLQVDGAQPRAKNVTRVPTHFKTFIDARIGSICTTWGKLTVTYNPKTKIVQYRRKQQNQLRRKKAAYTTMDGYLSEMPNAWSLKILVLPAAVRQKSRDRGEIFFHDMLVSHDLSPSAHISGITVKAHQRANLIFAFIRFSWCQSLASCLPTYVR